MNCYKCRNAEMVAELGTVNYTFSGLPFEVQLLNVPVQRCPSCGEQVDSIPRPEELHRILGLHMVEKAGRLEGAEVRFLRKLLDWSAKDLAKVFGVDSKTVSRWENDKDPMGPVSERLLRLLVRDLEPVEGGSASWVMHSFPSLSEAKERPRPVRLEVSNGRWGVAA